MPARFFILLCGTLAIAAGAKTFGEDAATDPAVDASSGRGKFRTVAMEWLNRSGQRPVTYFGLTVDPAVHQAPIDRPLVILIHGYNSCPERMAELATAVRQAGYPCGTLRYPNDQPIADSAKLLSGELHRLASDEAGRKIALVTHSMGGLVAREVVENAALDPGNVSQLLMIAPPSHGTSCAYLACRADVLEHRTDPQSHNLLDCLYSSIEDGLGEARHDLKPNSSFLEQLNHHSRNPNVRYTVFLGTGTVFSEEQLAQARRILEKCAQADSFVATVEPALQRALSDFEDAVEEGDGVVSVNRGRLEGVPDTVLLGFNHWNALGEPNCESVAALHREILKRLASQPKVERAAPTP